MNPVRFPIQKSNYILGEHNYTLLEYSCQKYFWKIK